MRKLNLLLRYSEEEAWSLELIWSLQPPNWMTWEWERRLNIEVN